MALGSGWRGELLLVAGLFLPVSALSVGLVDGRLDMSQFLLLHVGVCATGAALALCWIWRPGAAEHAGSRTAILLHATVWMLLAGPFGAILVAALSVPRAASRSREEGASDQATAQPPELTRAEMLHSRLLDHRLRLEQAHRIRPLLDVMIDGTQVEKLDAIRLIAKRYVPGLAPTIRRALEDRDAAVRVFAATVMAQQHNAHTKRIGVLKNVATNAPACMENWLELAQAHADYAASGLLETSRAEAETQQADTYLDRAAQVAASAGSV